MHKVGLGVRYAGGLIKVAAVMLESWAFLAVSSLLAAPLPAVLVELAQWRVCPVWSSHGSGSRHGGLSSGACHGHSACSSV